MVFSVAEYRRRVGEAVALLRALGGDYIVVSPSANMTYFTGLRIESLERIALLFINTDGDTVLLLPQLVRVPDYVRELMETVFWDDSSGPSRHIDRIARDLRIYGKRGFFEDSMTLSQIEYLRERLSPEKISLLSRISRDLRYRKSDEELARIYSSVRTTERILGELYNLLVPGVSERFLERQILGIMASENVEPGFRPIVAFGENTADPHHRPSDRVLRPGDPVIVDIGVAGEDWYVSDLTRVFVVGTPPRELRDLFETYKTCYEEVLRALRAGVKASEIDLVSRTCLTDSGLGRYIVHRTGHGIGLEVHEPPYLSIGSEDVLEKRVVFTIEPGVYIEGSLGVRVESDIVITDDGVVLEIDKMSRDIIIY